MAGRHACGRQVWRRQPEVAARDLFLSLPSEASAGMASWPCTQGSGQGSTKNFQVGARDLHGYDGRVCRLGAKEVFIASGNRGVHNRLRWSSGPLQSSFKTALWRLEAVASVHEHPSRSARRDAAIMLCTCRQLRVLLAGLGAGIEWRAKGQDRTQVVWLA